MRATRWSTSSPRTGTSSRTGCRWRAPRAMPASRCMSRPASIATAPPSRREGFHLHPLAWRRGSFNPRDLAADRARGPRALPHAQAGSRPSRRRAGGRGRIVGRHRSADRLRQRHHGSRHHLPRQQSESTNGTADGDAAAARAAQSHAIRRCWYRIPTIAPRSSASASAATASRWFRAPASISNA